MLKEVTEKIYQNIIRFRYLVLLFLIISAAFSATGLSKLSLALGPKVWFPENASIVKELDEFAQLFGNDETIVVAVHSKSGIFNTSTLNSINQIADQLWQVTDVMRVESLINYNHSYSEDDDIVIEPLFPDTEDFSTVDLESKKKIALTQEELVGRLISKDGKTALIFGHLKPYFGVIEPDYKAIDFEVKELINQFQSDDLDIYISGTIAITAEGRTVIFNDIKTFGPLILLFIFVLLVFYFRTIIGVAVPLIVVFLTLVCSFGLMGHMGLKFNSLTFVTPLTLMAIAIADSIHFIATYYRNREQYSKEEALRKSFHKNFYPTLLTSVTTTIGFFSLLTAELLTIETLGIISGMGTLLAWLLTVLALPPLVFMFAKDKSTMRSFQFNIHFIENLVDQMFKHNKKIIVFFVMLFFGSLYLTLNSKVNFNFFAGFKKDVQVTRANQFLLDNFGGVLGPELIIDSGKENGVKDPAFLRKVRELQDWMIQLPEVNNASSIVNVIEKMNGVITNDRSLEVIPNDQRTVAELIFLYNMGLPQGANINHLVSHDQSKLRLTVLWTIQSAVEAHARVVEINAKIKELGLDAYVTGRVKLYQVINDTIVKSLTTSMSVAIFFITIFIMIFLRSVAIGLFSLIPNIFPLMLGIGYLKLSGYDIDSGVVVVLSVCLGIAVDDTLHFFSHFLQGKKENLSLRENFIVVLHGTGNSLIITTVVLCLGFGVFSFSNHVTNSNFGALSAIILACALILDLVLLPSLMITFKKLFHFDKESVENKS